MTAGLKCGACGAVNPLGRKFCMKCGATLNFENLVQPGVAGAGRRIFRTIRLLVLLALLVALVQLLRAVSPEGRLGTDADAARFAVRLNHLQSGALNGEPVEETLPEAELNGYLHHLLTNSPSRSAESFIKADLTGIRAQLLPGTLVVVWTARVGALPLSYEVTCTPNFADSGLQFVLLHVRMGHLPLPGPVGEWASRRLVRMFDNLEREQMLLNSLTDLQLGEGHALARSGGSR